MIRILLDELRENLRGLLLYEIQRFFKVYEKADGATVEARFFEAEGELVIRIRPERVR